MRTRKSESYEALRDKWYGKLKKSGFKDIENCDTGLLNDWSLRFSRTDAAANVGRTVYYREAGQFFYSFPFANKVDKRIWELHSEAISIRNIVKILTKEKVWYSSRVSSKGADWKCPCKYSVNNAIKRLSTVMLTEMKNRVASDVE